LIFGGDTCRRKPKDWGSQLIWLLGILISGPIGLVLYWLTRQRKLNSDEQSVSPPYWCHILEITTLLAIALAMGSLLAGQVNATLLINVDFRFRFVQDYATTLVVSWLLTLLVRRSYRFSVPAHLLLMNVFWVSEILFPALLPDVIRIPYWLFFSTVLLIAIPITYPFHAWLVRCGFVCGLHFELSARKPSRLDKIAIIGILTLSFLAALGSVVVVVQIYTELPWQEVLRILISTP
jgi:hypothetical protein